MVNTELRPVSCVLWETGGIGAMGTVSGDTANAILKVGLPKKNGPKWPFFRGGSQVKPTKIYFFS